MRTFLVIVTLLFPRALSAQRQALDYGLLAGSTALLVMDWSQTRQFPNAGASEGDPLLGTHPSIGRVNTVFSLAVFGNAAALLFPSRPRRVWYVAVCTAEGWAVFHNLRFGWHVQF